jgi:probable rRNA maturation factor
VIVGQLTEQASLELDLRVHVRRRSGARPDRQKLREVCRAVLVNEGVTGSVILTLTLVDDEEIRQINNQHRGIDRTTDVLSFSLVESSEGFALPPGVPRELGDVVVSYPRAVAQAEEFGHSVERELAYLVVHGLLHILGHDHEVPAEQAVMRAREEAALDLVGLVRPA